MLDRAHEHPPIPVPAAMTSLLRASASQASIGPVPEPEPHEYRRAMGPSRPDPAFIRHMEQTQLTADRARLRAQHAETMEELAPRATGRDRVVEKKLERRALNRERDGSPGDVPALCGVCDGGRAGRGRVDGRGQRLPV